MLSKITKAVVTILSVTYDVVTFVPRQLIYVVFRKQFTWPTGLASLGIFIVCLVVYYFNTPYYGSIPYLFMRFEPLGLNWMLEVVQGGLIAGFCHASLAHMIMNMLVLLPCMAIVEQKKGPITLIFLYVLTGIVGNIFEAHMLQGTGLGASCAVYGFAVIALGLCTKGISRMLLIAPLIAMCMEVAQWWMAVLDGIGHLSHVGGAAVGFIYLLVQKDK